MKRAPKPRKKKPRLGDTKVDGKICKENRQLREVVKKYTQELEEKNRELEIEASLDRVRAATMAMRQTNDLNSIIGVVFKELTKLELELTRIAIWIFNDDKSSARVWIANPEIDSPSKGSYLYLPPNKLPPFVGVLNAWKSKKKFWKYVVTGKVKKEWEHFLFVDSDFAAFIPKKIKEAIRSSAQYTFHASLHEFGCLHCTVLEPLSAAQLALYRRFGKVFDQAYRRFLDIQKAEAQARESQIEAALEKIRSRSLAMHQSDELREVVVVMFDKMRELGLKFDGALICLFNEKEKSLEYWIATRMQSDPVHVLLPFEEKMKENQVVKDTWHAWRTGEDILNRVYGGKDKNEYFRYVARHNSSKIPEEVQAMHQRTDWTISFAAASNCLVALDSWSGHTTSMEAFQTLKRFARVFEQAYTRFLDLQKAEAQAREAQIEVALEKVRAKMMAMHHSEGLPDVMKNIYEEMSALGIHIDATTFSPMDDKKDLHFWTATLESAYPIQVVTPYLDHPLFNKIHEAKIKRHDFLSFTLSKEETDAWWKHFLAHSNLGPLVPEQRKKYLLGSKGYTYSMVLEKTSTLNIVNYEGIAFSDEENSILRRFGKVFDQAYTRFLDLQKAEAQAREAQIETALERVRSKTMAMHSSEDVTEAMAVMFKELENLGVNNLRCGIAIFHEDNTMDIWSVTTLQDGKLSKGVGKFDMNLHPLWRRLSKEQKAGVDFMHDFLGGQDKEAYIRILNSSKYLSNPILEMPDSHFQTYFFKEGGVWAYSLNAHNENQQQIMKRFTAVFSLTFRRYQDLKNAEAQAREAQIEAGLERVRSKAMAMQTSEDVGATTAIMFGELFKLGIDVIRCGILIIDESQTMETWTTLSSKEGGDMKIISKLDMTIHPLLQGVFRAWKNKEDLYVYHLVGEDVKAYYNAMTNAPGYPVYSQYVGFPDHYCHVYLFPEGGLYTFSFQDHSEATRQVLKKFSAVFALTFRRFQDLKRSETNTKEAIRQSSLDRVRAEIASMRTVEDLDRITPLIWRELTTLGIPFVRCGVFIMDDEKQLIHTFLSTPDGRAIAVFHVPFDIQGRIRDILEQWRKKEAYITHWNLSAFEEFADQMIAQGRQFSRQQYMSTVPEQGIHLHCMYFMQGMLYVGSLSPLNADDLHLVQSVADAFSTAYARYEDFNKLEVAKKQVETALSDLKQAQQQLVQAEKMASLGELTAGIAHEIQNPLNFVNNFSEVSNELIREIKELRQKTGDGNNHSEENQLLNDISGNLEKINFHGQRADAIVKSMLQHSRKSTGQKEPTDLNALCDEYVRLAYHGFRAKEKSFNARFDTQLDPALPKVSVVQQEIGRVILNLINNAFYTVNEKSKSSVNGYEPSVAVSTKHLGDKVEISIQDNGMGIPDSIKDKIFQPFFTTKPTGQGTGLGLSLAYDIVTKGHGGELRVESKEGSGSVFTLIILI